MLGEEARHSAVLSGAQRSRDACVCNVYRFLEKREYGWYARLHKITYPHFISRWHLLRATTISETAARSNSNLRYAGDSKYARLLWDEGNFLRPSSILALPRKGHLQAEKALEAIELTPYSIQQALKRSASFVGR